MGMREYTQGDNLPVFGVDDLPEIGVMLPALIVVFHCEKKACRENSAAGPCYKIYIQ